MLRRPCERRALRTLLVVLLLGPADSAQAHGEPAAITQVIAADDRGPWLLRLSEGLALRESDGFRFLCPARFGPSGIAFTVGSADGAEAFVLGGEDIYRLRPDGTIVASRAPDLAGSAVLAVAPGEGDELYVLRIRESGGTRLFRFSPSGIDPVWEDDVEWAAVAAFRGEIVLAHAVGTELSLARVALSGELLERLRFEVSGTLWSLDLRVAGDRLFVVGLRSDDHALLEVEGARLTERTQQAAEILGPVVDDRDDALHVLADGELIALPGGERERLTSPGAATCLEEEQGKAYACVETQVLELAEDGARLPVFGLSQLGPPVLEPEDAASAACRDEWRTFASDLRSVGVVSQEVEEVASITSERVPLEGRSPGPHAADRGCSVHMGRGGHALMVLLAAAGMLWTLRIAGRRR